MMQERPGDASCYMYNGACVPYNVTAEVIHVKGERALALRGAHAARAAPCA